MGLLKCEMCVVGPIQTNCYFLYDEETKECLVFDPGEEADKLYGMAQRKGLQVTAILLTHGHFDHITAADELRKRWKVEVYAPEAERELMADANLNASNMAFGAVTFVADRWLADGQELTMLGQTVRCISTPGHTIGGMCYYFPKAGYLFSGDTLFQASVGRTDLPTGSSSTLIRSVREKLFVLPEAVQVFPGHGMMTSIREERMFNPFAVV